MRHGREDMGGTVLVCAVFPVLADLRGELTHSLQRVRKVVLCVLLFRAWLWTLFARVQISILGPASVSASICHKHKQLRGKCGMAHMSVAIS